MLRLHNERAEAPGEIDTYPWVKHTGGRLDSPLTADDEDDGAAGPAKVLFNLVVALLKRVRRITRCRKMVHEIRELLRRQRDASMAAQGQRSCRDEAQQAHLEAVLAEAQQAHLEAVLPVKRSLNGYSYYGISTYTSSYNSYAY